ncbi:hypothetical protein ACOJIV_27275 [Haloarcula sp. AONF1]
MNRRTVIASVGGLATAGGMAVGSGAFTSVEAERAVDVTVANDTDAYLSPQPVDESGNPVQEGREPDAQGVPYSRIDDTTGRFTLDVVKLNANAVTTIPKVFRIANAGVQEVGLFIEKSGNEPTALNLFDQNGNRLDIDQDPNEVADADIVRIPNGEQVVVDIEVDTHSVTSDDNPLVNKLTIHGDANRGGQS